MKKIFLRPMSYNVTGVMIVTITILLDVFWVRVTFGSLAILLQLIGLILLIKEWRNEKK